MFFYPISTHETEESSCLVTFMMVKGKSQVIKGQSNKRIPVSASKHAAPSPAQSCNKSKTSKQSLMSCCGCDAVITDDTKALQCDRCQSSEAWKCAICLNIPADMYDHLVSDPNCSLRWFCSKCDNLTMQVDTNSPDKPDKIDTLVNLVEKLLEKLSTVDSQMKEKCDIESVNQLEAKVNALENCVHKQEQEHKDSLSMLEQKIMQYLDDRACKQSSSDQTIGTREVTQSVAEEVTRRIERDNDIEKRKNNIILYKVAEADADNAIDRNTSDLAFVTELLDCVFKIHPSHNGINRLFRLGRWDSSKDSPRPLLVEFAQQESKDQVMSSLGCLRDAEAPYKGISVAHDMSPWQREETKKLVEQAKQEHVSRSNEPVENFWFLVVGRGAKMRIMTVRKKREVCSVTDCRRHEITVPQRQHVTCHNHCSINSSELICVYFNAQSIMNKLDDLHVMVSSLQPDIIGISESWTNSNVLDSELSISGYDIFRCDRPNSRRGGGVLLYVRSELQPTQCFLTSSFPEQVWCELRNKNKGDLLIGVCYRTPTTSIYDSNIDSLLRDLLNELNGKHFVLMGDFNYPGIDWQAKSCLPTASRETQLFLNCCEDNFYEQHVTATTRMKSILDLVLTDTLETVDNVQLLGQFADSDHSMLQWNISHESTIHANNQQDFIGTYDNAKGNFAAMHQELAAVDWTELLQSLPIADCWKAFKEIINRLEERYIPKKKLHKTKMQKPIWMTYKAMRLVKRKQNVYKRYKNVHRPAYVKATKEVKKEIKKAKKKFEYKLAQNIKEDKKSFYAYVRSKNKSKPKIEPLAGDNGDVIEDITSMAKNFNKFFSSVFTVEDTENMPAAENVFSSQSAGALRDVIVCENIIKGKLAKLRSDKAAGADAMSPWLLKEVHDLLVTPISILLRKSLDDGEVPDDWKIANVSPIFKKGVKSQTSNYRPVSLTSQVSKVIESVLRDAIVSHLETNELIRDSQHGFRKGRSCLTNLLVFLDKVTKYIDDGYSVDVIYLDFAKAFDKVPHQRLLDKLKGHGINGKVFNWIESWLTNRRQRVCVRGKFSDWIPVPSGVPQGSVLGPVLFLIFINDLEQGLGSQAVKFADDTKVFSQISTVRDCEILQQDLVLLQNGHKIGKCSLTSRSVRSYILEDTILGLSIP